ncbi:MAG: Oligopeptide transport system permease protein OppC [Candidatus Thorarchaeota archaeon]|nr:MAG: Oligopeptide transport system permease protein OppC [Candidatus Thorarchaeota archaeon]
MSDSKSSSWKDSNWYVSLTGFWKEYRKHKIGILGIIVLFLFVGMAFAAPWLATHDPAPGKKVAPSFLAPEWMAVFDPEGVLTDEYMPDPQLTNEPTFRTFGNSSKFSYDHFTGAGNDGRVNMTWEHKAGDRMNWAPPNPMSQYPDSEDFVIFMQNFTWPFEGLPSDVNITFTYSVSLTGTFATEENSGLMFKTYIWLIDSSGDWQRVYRSFPPYSSEFQTRKIDLNFFDLNNAWGGMVEDDGVQEDPTDELTVAVGLAPTDNFRYHLGETPSLNYTGSVTLTVEEVSLVAYGDYFGVLGTTDKGADAWSQLVYGSRISLTIGILATALSTAVGVIVGLTAGYFGGKTDEILMRVVDFLLVIPGLPLMMVLAAFLGPTIENIIVVIAILGWTGTSRLIRSQVMAEKNKAYVESARAIGASDTYIIFRHILPNVTPILFADITLGVVAAILSESGLAFLGLTDPNEPSWGRMLADAQGTGGFSNGAWWVVVFPGLMITILSLAFTFVGHTLDQVLNPRLRER